MLLATPRFLYFVATFISMTRVAYCGILYPQESESREVKRLDGIWEFRAQFGDKIEQGFEHKWFKKPLRESGEIELMPVPSSYNDVSQSKRLRDHVGWVWYSTTFWAPRSWKKDSRRIHLRFGSANHFAIVWVNGEHLMNHTGGYLPFVGEVTEMIQDGKQNLLVVALNNTLTPLTIPQGTLRYPNDTSRYPKGFTIQGYNFDYFNFAGIHRPVFLYTTPHLFIDDITVSTSFHGTTGVVHYRLEGFPRPSILEEEDKSIKENVISSRNSFLCSVRILDARGTVVGSSSTSCDGRLEIPSVHLWWPYLSQPVGEVPGYLYTLVVKLTPIDNPKDADMYHLKFGVRTVQVEQNQFLVNGKPFYFRGFGRHEDYNIRGRGVDPVMIVKDHNLLKWVGANSYRTSHYPYAEEILDLTDRLGILIIDESPAIGLSGYGSPVLASHIAVMRELVQRDKNRPSVMMWSIGNEPKSMEKAAPAYFQKVIDETRKADVAGRPITIVLSQDFYNSTCPSLDVISINRYFGWYADTGRTEVIQLQIPTEVETWFKKYSKPVLITEYGAGTVAGFHQSPSFVWTEDYQLDYFMAHWKAFDEMRKTKPYFIGEMIWNFADFATPEETFRPWGCMKGIFTRDRQPKMAAHFVRSRYWNLANETASCDPSLGKNPLPNDLKTFLK